MDVEFDHISKRRDDDVVLADVSFRAYAGQITGLVGRNGAGKSTAYRVALGLVAADSGIVTFGGRPIAQVDRRDLGIYLEPVANPACAVETHLTIRAQRLGLSADSVMSAMKLLQITPLRRRRIGRLSLGQRQRVSLATALLGQPGVLMLDEPANGLDPDGIMWLNRYLKHRAVEGATVLVSSHSLAELDNLVDSVVVLDRSVRWAGRISDMRRSGFSTIEHLFVNVANAPSGAFR
jgi:ABC-2 type transport system ATP-binding protein